MLYTFEVEFTCTGSSGTKLERKLTKELFHQILDYMEPYTGTGSSSKMTVKGIQWIGQHAIPASASLRASR